MKSLRIVLVLGLCFLVTGCSHRVEFEESEVVLEGDSKKNEFGVEEDMDGEYTYFDDVEIKDPVIFAMMMEDGVLSPSEVYAKRGDYILLRINNLGEEHAIVIPEYGWRTILHEDEETEFGFRARERGRFPFHCSAYCTQKENHISGMIVVE